MMGSPKKRKESIAAKKTRVKVAVGILEEALDSYEKNHPHWKAEALIGLIEWSLRSLRHYLEDARDKEITWAAPFVELPYAVEWEWEQSRTRGEQYGRILYGHVTDQNVADRETTLATLSAIMARQVTVTALGDLTHWVRFADQNGARRCYLPVELEEALCSIKSKPRREAAFEDIIRPFSIGAGLVDFDGMGMRDGERVPPKVTRQLAKLHEAIDIPDFRFTGEVDGRKIDLRLIFQIHPLITNHDEERARHPITVGLFFEPKVSGRRVTFPQPGRWPQEVREKFWEELFAALTNFAKELIPKKEIERSVILEFHGQLKIPAEHWSPQKRGDVMKMIMDSLSAGGEVTRLDVRSPDAGSLPQSDACATCGWTHDRGFMEIRVPGYERFSLPGVLPDIVRCVHNTHEKGVARLGMKDETLVKACGGYFHPSKAFYDLGQRDAYRVLFNTSRRGFISLRGLVAPS